MNKTSNPLLASVSCCGILWQGREFEDENGCIKPEGHNDSHIFKTIDGRFIEWEDDYQCTCGCWDDNHLINVCKVYREVSDSTVLGAVKK